MIYGLPRNSCTNRIGIKKRTRISKKIASVKSFTRTRVKIVCHRVSNVPLGSLETRWLLCRRELSLHPENP